MRLWRERRLLINSYLLSSLTHWEKQKLVWIWLSNGTQPIYGNIIKPSFYFFSALVIAILTVYKQLFWHLNFSNHRTKESFVTATNKPLVGTLMTIGDVTVSIAIARKAWYNSICRNIFVWEMNNISMIYITKAWSQLTLCTLNTITEICWRCVGNCCYCYVIVRMRLRFLPNAERT